MRNNYARRKQRKRFETIEVCGVGALPHAVLPCKPVARRAVVVTAIIFGNAGGEIRHQTSNEDAPKGNGHKGISFVSAIVPAAALELGAVFAALFPAMVGVMFVEAFALAAAMVEAMVEAPKWAGSAAKLPGAMQMA